MSELWRRWHISLSTWANDYLFLPLSSALSRMKRKAIVLSLFITFLVIGIWHGANWTFVVFGIIHGTTVVIEFLTTKQRKLVSKKINIKLYNFLAWLITMLIWLLGLVFFRADSIGAAFSYLDNFRYSNSNPEITSTIFTTSFLALLVYLLIMLIMEWKNKAYL